MMVAIVYCSARCQRRWVGTGPCKAKANGFLMSD